MAEDPPPPPPQSFFSTKNEGKSALISPEPPRPRPLNMERLDPAAEREELRIRDERERAFRELERIDRRRRASQIAIAVVVGVLVVLAVWWWLSR